MNTPQNPSESAFQIGEIVISIIPTIRTFSYIFVPICDSRFSSDSHFFVLFRTFSCTNGRQTLARAPGAQLLRGPPPRGHRRTLPPGAVARGGGGGGQQRERVWGAPSAAHAPRALRRSTPQTRGAGGPGGGGG